MKESMMVKQSKSAGDCVVSTSGETTTDNPASQGFAPFAGGPMTPGAVRGFCNAALIDCANDTASELQAVLEDLCLYTKHALEAASVVPTNHAIVELLQLIRAHTRSAIVQACDLDSVSQALSERLLSAEKHAGSQA